MKYLFFLIMLLICVGNNGFSQYLKVDSTLKMGKVGYRVTCNNKSPEQNEIKIKPVGFDKDAKEMGFYIKGRLQKAEIDDLNNDGFPDLVLYIYGGVNGVFGTVYAFASEENKSIAPFALPDVMLDGKLKDGYKGHDEFTLLEGKLMQQFPIFKPEDAKDKATGGKRVVIYTVLPSNGGFQFKVLRTYDLKETQ